MFWADRTVDKIKKQYSKKIAEGKPLIIRDEKTASGRVHVGSLRGVAIHGIISEILTEQKIANKYLYEINDFDPMDGIPVYLDKKMYEPYMGKPLNSIPSPDGKAKNFAEYFAEEFIQVITELGFTPEYYRSSDVYKRGDYNETITLALKNSEKIRAIYKKVSNSDKEGGWLPIQMICENCGKLSTTRATAFDGEKVEYTCGNYVEWAAGCGHKGSNSPFNGNAKLPWKVEWAAKFKVFDVDVEGAGKDHSTKGGSRDIAEAISEEIFNHKPPFNIPYEFFQVEGKKMSSSKGAGSSSREVADLLPPNLLRLLLLQKEPQRTIDFVPDGDTVPVLYDSYDKLAEHYFANTGEDYPRIFKIMHRPEDQKHIVKRYLPRFSQLAYLVQMPHLDIKDEVKKEKGGELTSDDIKEIELRKEYALKWLNTYAPEDFKFELQKTLPEQAKTFTQEQKNNVKKVLEYIQSQEKLDGQVLHTALHEIKNASGIKPQDFFSAIYLSLLNKPSGPKAGWFLSVLDKSFVEKRLGEVVNS